MKRTRKSDVSLEVKVGVQSVILAVYGLRRKEWHSIFSGIVGLGEEQPEKLNSSYFVPD